MERQASPTQYMVIAKQPRLREEQPMFFKNEDHPEGLRENRWINSLIGFGICLLLLTILFI